jgi:hypothetical protein
VICSQQFFLWLGLLFFRPPSDPLQVRFLGLEIRVRFLILPQPKFVTKIFLSLPIPSQGFVLSLQIFFVAARTRLVFASLLQSAARSAVFRACGVDRRS